MREIEVKILEIEKDAVEERLRKLEARKTLDAVLTQETYDLPGQKLRKQHKTLRIRTDGKETILAFKQPIPGISDAHAKARDESELSVENFAQAGHILTLLGYHRTTLLKKHRVSYSLPLPSQASGKGSKIPVHFDIDSYITYENHERRIVKKYDLRHIPPFLEIEGRSIHMIYHYASLLGFKAKDCKPLSTMALLKHYHIS